MAAAPPVPQRIPPLRWRSPSVLWTPLALASAIGWPAVITGSNQAALRLALLTGGAVFVVALLALGANWASGRAPRVRRTVVVHVVWTGVAIYLLAPFVLSDLVTVAASGPNPAAERSINLGMSLALVPLSLLLGLPATLASALIFAWLAFEPPSKRGPVDVAIDRGHVQPFE